MYLNPMIKATLLFFLFQGCIYNNGSNAEHILITKEDLRAGQEVVIKVICSNEQCTQSPYMHTACFQTFEESVLCYLKGQSRAKSWSDRTKLQNLWTKKAYDLVYKACACNCTLGHLRKDLDWSPALSVQAVCLSIISMLASCKEKVLTCN